jgi:hypothetical protein
MSRTAIALCAIVMLPAVAGCTVIEDGEVGVLMSFGEIKDADSAAFSLGDPQGRGRAAGTRHVQ